MRIVFAGTPEPALPSLRRLIASPHHDVAAVLTRPDAAAGRRAKPSPSPVARLALEHGIPVLRPRRPNSDEFVAEFAELAPEACAVVAYGALLGDGLLAVPERGWINLHFSLLPAWRGAAPVQAAIAAGDTVTGATTFQIEPALDSGPVYGVVTETIRPTDTAGDLLDRLSISGAALLETTLDGIADGTLSPIPQPSDGVTVAPKVTVDDARVRWDLPAHVVDRRIRAVTPNPGAWTMVGELRIKLGPVSVDDATPESLSPGAIRVDRNGVRIGTASQPVLLGRVQPPGKKQMEAADWARGARLDEAATAIMTKPRRPRRKPLDPARRAAFDVLRAVSERDAYANLALPALLRERGITGRRRRLRDRTDLRRVSQPRTARRRHRPCRRTPTGKHQSGAAGPAATRHLPVAAHARRRARGGGHHRRAGWNRIRFGAGGFRQRCAAHHLGARRTVLDR